MIHFSDITLTRNLSENASHYENLETEVLRAKNASTLMITCVESPANHHYPEPATCSLNIGSPEREIAIHKKKYEKDGKDWNMLQKLTLTWQ